MLDALEQSSDCGLEPLFMRRYRLGNLLMLVRSSAARAVSISTRTATTGVRVLLESSVDRVQLGVAAAAAAECS